MFIHRKKATNFIEQNFDAISWARRRQDFYVQLRISRILFHHGDAEELFVYLPLRGRQMKIRNHFVAGFVYRS